MLHERTNRIDSAAGAARSHPRRMRTQAIDDLQGRTRSRRTPRWRCAAKDYAAGARSHRSIAAPRNCRRRRRPTPTSPWPRSPTSRAMPARRCASWPQAHAIQLRLRQGNRARKSPTPTEEPLRIATKWMHAGTSAISRADPMRPSRRPIAGVHRRLSAFGHDDARADARRASAVRVDGRAHASCRAASNGWRRRGLEYPVSAGPARCAADLVELRALYWAEVGKGRRPRRQAQTLVDKNPLNMLRLPMIRRLFPAGAHHPRPAPSLRRDPQLLHAELPLAGVHGAVLDAWSGWRRATSTRCGSGSITSRCCVLTR